MTSPYPHPVSNRITYYLFGDPAELYNKTIAVSLAISALNGYPLIIASDDWIQYETKGSERTAVPLKTFAHFLLLLNSQDKQSELTVAVDGYDVVYDIDRITHDDIDCLRLIPRELQAPVKARVQRTLDRMSTAFQGYVDALTGSRMTTEPIGEYKVLKTQYEHPQRKRLALILGALIGSAAGFCLLYFLGLL